MTPTTEEYVARLRTSARLDELHSELQPERVLAASRRAKRRRTLGVTAVVLCGVVTVALGGPTVILELRRGLQVQPAVLPEDHEVAIDTTIGTITLPLDRYSLSETEQFEVVRASGLAMRACAAERGYEISDPGSDVLISPTRVRDQIGDQRFGVWWMPSAEKYGYGTWSTPQQRYGVDVHGERTDEQRAILDACGETPAVQQFWPDTQVSGGIPDFVKQTFDSEAAQPVLDDWQACLLAHGLSRDEALGRWDVTDGKRRSGSTPVENGEPLSEDSAVIDAQCKADARLVERLAQMVADRQAPFIAAHRPELTATRASLEDSLERARAYIAEHG